MSGDSVASSEDGASPWPVKRFSQMRSATRMWFSVPSTDLK